jgi:hypothetical protein
MCCGRVGNAVSLAAVLSWYSLHCVCARYQLMYHFSESQERGSNTCSSRPMKTVNDSQNVKEKLESCITRKVNKYFKQNLKGSDDGV